MYLALTLQGIIDDLLEQTGASRCTLRQDVPGAHAYPVTHEALAPGVHSLKELWSVDQAKQPVVLHLLGGGSQVVQRDSRREFPDDPEFHGMRKAYGGLAAQIVTPVVIGESVVGIISLHQLEAPREWAEDDARLCSTAASDAAALIKGSR